MWKAEPLMIFIVGGKKMVTRELQPKKAEPPISLTLVTERSAELRPTPLKAWLPMLSRVGGKEIETSKRQ